MNVCISCELGCNQRPGEQLTSYTRASGGACLRRISSTLSSNGCLNSKMAADSGMDTCPSPEIADSRKRPLDGDNENGDTKRSHFSTGNASVFSYDSA